MGTIDRRKFGSILGVGAATLMVPVSLLGQNKPQVVIVGGGAGGATAARFLARQAAEQLDITLIEDAHTYTSCFYSNLYVGGVRSFESITHRYDTLAAEDGIRLVQGRAVDVDRGARVVVMADGSQIHYDRLLLSPGIDLQYDSLPGYSEADSEIAPHAWRGGVQVQMLKQQLDRLENGQNIVMVAPPNPYRCPPGPYERASMMAHILTAKGHTDSRITILDTKPAFSKQALFTQGWDRYYPGMIEWYPPDVHGGIESVNAKEGNVETDLDTFEGALLNIIPAQKAGVIADVAGLTNDTGFCPIDGTSMRSIIDENIFITGDASIAGAMPKSAFSANSQSKVAAMAIAADLLSVSAPAAQYGNICWSLIAMDHGVKVGASYAPADDGSIESTSTFVSQIDEDDKVRSTTYEQSIAWYTSIITDMFG